MPTNSYSLEGPNLLQQLTYVFGFHLCSEVEK